MIKDDLIALALRFRTYKLWEKLDDSMIFSVRLPGGEIGYCCVMGNGGEHFALGLYKGVSGFATYMNSMERLPGLDPFEMMQTYDSLNCDFENSSDSNLTPAAKKHVRVVADEHGLKICRPKGFPEFVRYDYGVIRTEFDEAEMADMPTALEAAIEVAEKIKSVGMSRLSELGFADDGMYATRDGGLRLPLLEKQPDGKFVWTVGVTPEVAPFSFAPVVLNDPEAFNHMRKLSKKGKIQCKVMHMPTSLKSEEGIYNPLMIILINESGEAIPVIQQSDGPQRETELLQQLASMCISTRNCPRTILVDDQYSYTFMQDFCEKAGITLKKEQYMPQLAELKFMLSSTFGL